MTHIRLTWTHPDHPTQHGTADFSLPVTISRQPENSLVLNARIAGVSRHHVQLCQRNGHIWLRDLDSTNGVYVNGRLVRETIISSGNHFILGRYCLILQKLVCCAQDYCQRWVSSEEQLCPWCGHFLADAITHLSIHYAPSS
jgi:pSer/pThr/pTyr-binding forkhead associated (FHA) protein